MPVSVTSYSDPKISGMMPFGPKHPLYTHYFPDWLQIRDCIAGERTIKERDTLYLPRLEAQKQQDYGPYKARAVFYNATSRTVEGLMGSIFRRPFSIQNIDEEKINLKNITRTGESFTTFLKQITEEVISVGRVGALVDLPDEESINPDPYICVYNAENILNWSTGLYQGRRILTSVLLIERTTSVDANFVATVSEMYRHLYLEYDLLGAPIYRQGIYKLGEGMVNGKKTPMLQSVQQGITPKVRGKTLEFIPFQFFGPKNLTPEVQKPPVYDISTLNLAHYRSNADLEHGRHYTAVPVYWITGAGDETEEFKAGPNIVWKLNQGDEAGILEFTGKGLESLEKSCTEKERQIASLGGRLVGPKPGTAAQSTESTKVQEDGEEATLLNITQKISEGSTILLKWYHLMMDIEPDEKLSVELNQDFSQGEITAREMRAIESLWEARVLPLDVLYKVFREAGIIPSYIQLEEFKLLLKDKEQIPEEEVKDVPNSGGSNVKTESKE